jgi:hypothetical protein
MTSQETPMPYASCQTAVINAPVDVVWALLMEPAAWGDVFNVRVGSIDPPGSAIVGKKISGETGLRIVHLKLAFWMIEIDLDHHRLRPDVNLPFGLSVNENLRCTPLDDACCRADYHCNFGFPRGWRGALMWALMNQRLDAGPRDSLSRP